MEQMDEKILKQRAEMEEFERQRFAKETIEEENKQSIFDGNILINKIPVAFSERPFFDGRVGIWLPDDFEQLSQEVINATYLLGNKPDIVLGNAYLNFSVGFHYTENEVPNAYMGELARLARLILENSGPKVNIYGEKVRKSGEHIISYLELVSHTIADAVYNIIFFSSLGDKVLIGFINFNYKFFNRYEPIAKEILSSFRFIEEEE